METLEEVLEFYNQNFDESVVRLIYKLQDPSYRTVMKTEGIKRIEAGWKEYGTTSWNYASDNDILQDILEELADGTVYEAIARSNVVPLNMLLPHRGRGING